MDLLNLFKFMPDDGADGGSVGSTDLAEVLNRSSYQSELAEEYQSDDFSGIEDVTKLYGAYRNSQAELQQARQDLEGSLRIPTSESSYDDIKAFFQKIGMPENSTDYALDDYGLNADEISQMKGNFAETAHKCGLTKAQAKALWQHEAATYSSVLQSLNDRAQELKGNFEARFDSELQTDYPDQTRRAERMTKDKNLFTEFVGKSELGEYFKATGLDLNPSFIHKLAKFYETYSSDAPYGSSGGRKLTEAERLQAKYPSMFSK